MTTPSSGSHLLYTCMLSSTQSSTQTSKQVLKHLLHIASDEMDPHFLTPATSTLDDTLGRKCNYVRLFCIICFVVLSPSARTYLGVPHDHIFVKTAHRCLLRFAHCTHLNSMPFKSREEMLTAREMRFFVLQMKIQYAHLNSFCFIR